MPEGTLHGVGSRIGQLVFSCIVGEDRAAETIARSGPILAHPYTEFWVERFDVKPSSYGLPGARR
ncbi:hypothetical protein HW511_11400 [Asaia siamensis]|uniref:hypothetical protein n=1 Tax=Asaia siamensis TaxID=110479 RepID=UPI00166F29C4|nr:hypothetical protein [Asaia siamensis]